MQSKSCLQNHNHKSNCFMLLYPRSVLDTNTSKLPLTAHIHRECLKCLPGHFPHLADVKKVPRMHTLLSLATCKNPPPVQSRSEFFLGLFGPRKLMMCLEQGPPEFLPSNWSCHHILNAPEISLLHWTTSTTLRKKQTPNLTQHHSVCPYLQQRQMKCC